MKIRFIIKVISSKKKISEIFRIIILECLKWRISSRYINKYYNRLNYKEKEIIHILFAKKSNERQISTALNKWIIFFNNREIIMPLRKTHMWLDWDSALSITGHDIEIKSAYEYLLQKLNLNCVFDVGSNYCTHSILFLSNGIKTYSFEPNKECLNFFEECQKLNDLKGDFINIAIGSKKGNVKLTFPKKKTWLGTISAKENDHVSQFENLKTITVSMDTLDSYSQSNNLIPDLIKIDTEGFEIEVLKGAKYILKNKKPIIIFESNEKEKRSEIYELLFEYGYGIYMLLEIQDNLFLDKESFENERNTNFIAIPNNHSLISIK